ncbi:MAG: N-acetyltransferase [Candidatus Sericytochromatia bacterium]|nr:N-acetyltransferase [Candidatus Sericytochromatia bacterium]
MSDYFVHASSYIDFPCEIGAGSKIWHFCHIMTGARLGKECNLGQNVMIASRVQIGDRVKIQNNVSVYEGTIIEDDVFLGPSCVLTNISNPRAQVRRQHLYEPTRLRRGCTVGANATLVCGIEIGRYAFIGAGAVVTQNVPDYALMLGNPARQKGWMSRHGHRLIPAQNASDPLICPESGLRYLETDGKLRCLDLDEDTPLPADLQIGQQSYLNYKQQG